MLFPVPRVQIASSGCSVSEDYGIDEHVLKRAPSDNRLLCLIMTFVWKHNEEYFKIKQQSLEHENYSFSTANSHQLGIAL